MAGGLNDIIARLEEQKSAIERALSALREIEVLEFRARRKHRRLRERSGRSASVESRLKVVSVSQKR
jgi:hypothetical protein